MKVGSYINYFLELAAACSLGVGLCWSVATARRRLPALVILLLLQGVLLARGNPMYAQLSSQLAHGGDQQRLLELVRTSRGPVLADDAMGLLPLAHKPVYIDPFSMTQLAYEGRWDDEALASDVRARMFSLILLHKSDMNPGRVHAMWTPRVYAAMRDAYEQVARIPVDADNYIAVLRPAAAGQ